MVTEKQIEEMAIWIADEARRHDIRRYRFSDYSPLQKSLMRKVAEALLTNPPAVLVASLKKKRSAK